MPATARRGCRAPHGQPRRAWASATAGPRSPRETAAPPPQGALCLLKQSLPGTLCAPGAGALGAERQDQGAPRMPTALPPAKLPGRPIRWCPRQEPRKTLPRGPEKAKRPAGRSQAPTPAGAAPSAATGPPRPSGAGRHQLSSASHRSSKGRSEHVQSAEPRVPGETRTSQATWNKQKLRRKLRRY